MIDLAVIRPDGWDLPLFLHVLGALVLTGALALCSTFLFGAARDGSTARLRLALRTLTIGVIPAWIVLRVGAEWIAYKEDIADLDETPSWIDIGYMASDVGFLLLVVAGLLGWRTLRRSRAFDGAAAAPSKAVRVASILIAVVLVLNVVAIWAMTTKPS